MACKHGNPGYKCEECASERAAKAHCRSIGAMVAVQCLFEADLRENGWYVTVRAVNFNNAFIREYGPFLTEKDARDGVDVLKSRIVAKGGVDLPNGHVN